MKKRDLFDFYKRVMDMDVLILFKGALSQEILLDIGKMINQHTSSFPSEIQKSFSVFVELSQNISRYSSEKEFVDGKEIGVGIILFAENDDCYKIYSGNKVDFNNIKSLVNKLEIINKMSNPELVDFYKNQRRKPKSKLNPGIGLGLIEIARKSTGIIDFSFNKLDDQNSFLELIVRVNKGKK